MTSWIRTRGFSVLAVLLLAALVAGCGGAKDTKTSAAAAPTATTAPAVAPAPAPVDKVAVAKELAVEYFNTMPTTFHQIDSTEVKKRMDAKDPNMFLLDIRRAEDFAKAHVEGFTNIPFVTVGQNLDKLPKDKQILVTCYTGQTAGQTIAALRMAGYNALSIKFGFQGIENSKVFDIKKPS